MRINDRIPTFALLGLYTALLLLTGCASTGTMQIHSPLSIQMSNYKTLEIDVQSQVGDAEQERTQLENLIIAQLRSKNSFDHIYSAVAALESIPDFPIPNEITAKCSEVIRQVQEA